MAMNLKAFFSYVDNELRHLAGAEYSFEELLKLSRHDRRIRNAFVLYALSNPEYKKRLWLLAERSLYVRRLKAQLHQALKRVTHEPLNRQETIKIAKQLLNAYFKDDSVVLEYRKYDASAEMEKFFTTVVNTMEMDKKSSPIAIEKSKRLVKSLKVNNLFVQN